VLTTARHTGPFASGNALNMGAELKPLDPEPVKTIQIDTTHKVIEIAPGVKFSGWTRARHCCASEVPARPRIRSHPDAATPATPVP
jgi:hypothetical protein